KGRYEIFEPHSSLYLDALQQVQQAALRFDRGAALQKNIVLGVLGHNLLERLDEHLLDLWEMAQALDPQRVWDSEDEVTTRHADEKNSPSAGWFAGKLLDLSENAVTIPNNLRTLQSLLAFSREERSHRGTVNHTLKTLLDESKNENWSIHVGSAIPL